MTAEALPAIIDETLASSIGADDTGGSRTKAIIGNVRAEVSPA